MPVFIITLLTLFISDVSFAIINVETPVPPPANVSFPNYQAAVASSPTSNTDPVKAAAKRDYFATLFDEVEVAKHTPPPLSEIKLYDQLAKESVAHGVLHEHPNLLVGPLKFRPLARNAPHAWEVRKGQELLLHAFGDKPYHYREMADSIDHQIGDPRSPFSDTDWVLMANAFRTLQAPGTSHNAHILGGFLSEYVLLAQIKKQESKNPLTPEDRAFLSSLHYDLSQLYQAMYKNDEKLFENRTHGQLTLPIDPIYREIGYHGDYPDEFDISYDRLFGTRLDLLENALLFDPYDDYSWGQLVDFAAFDLTNPWYYNQFTPKFWGDYFPYGFTRVNAVQLQNRWNVIRKNPVVIQNINLRAKAVGGERALRRLATVHSRHTSQLNRSIVRASHLSTAAIGKNVLPTHQGLRGKGHRQFTSPKFEKRAKAQYFAHRKSQLTHKVKPSHLEQRRPPFNTAHKAVINPPTAHMRPPAKARQQMVPHYATTQRATSIGKAHHPNKPHHGRGEAASPAVRARPAIPAARATPEVRAKAAVRAEPAVRAAPAPKASGPHDHKKKHSK